MHVYYDYTFWIFFGASLADKYHVIAIYYLLIMTKKTFRNPLETLVKIFKYQNKILKGIPSYFFQHFFEIAKRTFIIKEKKLYCTLMCKKCVTFHKSNKKIKFYSYRIVF